MKFINMYNNITFYISIIMLCFLAAVIALPMFGVFNKEITLYASIVSILFGILLVGIYYENKMEPKP